MGDRAPVFLHASLDAPGWGGAATTAYVQFERRQREGADAHYVNLVLDADAAMLQQRFGPHFGNPRRLANVHTCRLVDPWWRPLEGLSRLVDAVRPDLIVAHGFIAAGLLRMAAPGVPLVFLTTGSRQVKRLVVEGAVRDFADFARLVARGVTFDLPPKDQERQAVAGSDLIVLHTPHVRLAFEHFFPAYMGRVYERLISVADLVYGEAQPFASLARPFPERDLDVVFIASIWSRPEKNFALVRRLAAACGDLRLALVGAEAPDDAPLPRLGLLAREEIFALLGRARAIVSTSRFDPAPGVLFEADALGANVVASPNCGNWQLCHEQLLARTEDDFVRCIRRAVQAPLPANRAPFLGGYAELVDALETFVG
jgi:glycosyltransferase involved in cell wall biosynthesis